MHLPTLEYHGTSRCDTNDDCPPNFSVQMVRYGHVYYIKVPTFVHTLAHTCTLFKCLLFLPGSSPASALSSLVNLWLSYLLKGFSTPCAGRRLGMPSWRVISPRGGAARMIATHMPSRFSETRFSLCRFTHLVLAWICRLAALLV